METLIRRNLIDREFIDKYVIGFDGLALSSVEFSDAIKIYRVFLVVTTGLLGLWGFIGGIVLIIISSVTTPTFAKMSYFWPLFPFNWDALKTLLFRYPTTKAQPCKIWKREKD